MPAAAPEAWENARMQWELMPEMSITTVAQQLNVAIPTVSIRAKREGWSKVVVVDAELPAQTCVALAASALRRLNRIVEHSTDDNIATRAAAIILGYTLGRPTSAGALPAPGDDPSQGWPEWLTARRLAYQEQQGALQAPPQALDPPPPLPEPADASLDDPFRRSVDR